MALSAGIVGLPNVGKSTLFSAITKQQIYIANYPFATIEPNVGISIIKDPRLDFLAEKYKSEKIIHSVVKFIDIAGLVKGASEGDGLGNKFLAHIREVDAVVNVVRCFENKEIIHVDGNIDPIRDIKSIMSELILSDIEIVNNYTSKLLKKKKSGLDKRVPLEIKVFEKVKSLLWEEKLLIDQGWSEQENEIIRQLPLITNKKMIFFLNVEEESMLDGNEFTKNVIEFIEANYNCGYCLFSAEFENQLNTLKSEKERKEMMELAGIESPLIDKITLETFKLLGLECFLTAGPKETRSWTYRRGMTAKECAGVIHSDMRDKFIKAEIFSFNDFVENPSEESLKAKGKIRMEGKNYLMKDGDVCHFHFNK